MAALPSSRCSTSSGTIYIPAQHFGQTLTPYERDVIRKEIRLENKDRHRDFMSGKMGRPHHLKGWQR